ncbi:DUF2076 domain-containing protein [Massilia sp. CMS3.1]|uniref:DUF2076 domain-containing protein n=1 Tax=Massilia sp. CMS3.1 TaxID=3373083 RepID=UPI003EE505B6
MSPQDTQLLENFLNQLIQARGLPKDPAAEAMIAQAVSYQPDAAYLLVQRALLQQQALDNAKAEIAHLQQQLQGGAGSRGSQGSRFLDPNAWGNSGQQQQAQAYGSQPAQGGYPQQPYQQPSLASRASNFFRGGSMGGGMGGALGSIASTAAGVAAGAFLFQGLGNLLGNDNHDGNGFLGNNDSFSSLTSSVDEFANSANGAGDSSSSLLGDSNSDSGNALLDDAGSGGDDVAGDSYDGGMDDASLG